MPIAIAINDRVIFSGPNRLADWRWSQDTIALPAGLIIDGPNTLSIRSLAPLANYNAPPFFMLHAARVSRTPGDNDDDDD
jgi:hypothetical protein